jgi:hypothetical protein
MKGKCARWRSGRGRRKSCFRIEGRRNKDERGICGVGTRRVFKIVNWTVIAGVECGVGHVGIMAMEHARLDFEGRHHVRDQATGQRVFLSGHFALRPLLRNWTVGLTLPRGPA